MVFSDTLWKEVKGKIVGTGGRGRKVSSYRMTIKKQEDKKLKVEAVDRTAWKTRCERCYGSVARQTD